MLRRRHYTFLCSIFLNETRKIFFPASIVLREIEKAENREIERERERERDKRRVSDYRLICPALWNICGIRVIFNRTEI